MKSKLPLILLLGIFIVLVVASRFSNRGGSKAVYEGHQSGYAVCDYVDGVTFDVPEECLVSATTESMMSGSDDKYLRGYWIIKNTSSEYKLFCYGRLVVMVQKGTSFVSDSGVTDIKALIGQKSLNGTWFIYDNAKFSKQNISKNVLKTVGTVVGDIKINPQFYGNYAGRLAVINDGTEEWALFAGFAGSDYKSLSGTEKDIVCHMAASFSLSEERASTPVIEITNTPELTETPTPTQLVKTTVESTSIKNYYLDLKYTSYFYEENYNNFDPNANDKDRHTTFAGQMPKKAFALPEGILFSASGYWFADTSTCFKHDGILYGIFTYSDDNALTPVIALEDSDSNVLLGGDDIQNIGGFNVMLQENMAYIFSDDIPVAKFQPVIENGILVPVAIAPIRETALLKKNTTSGIYAIPSSEVISPVYAWEDDFVAQFCDTGYSTPENSRIVSYYMSDNASADFIDKNNNKYGLISAHGYPDWVIAWCKNNPELVGVTLCDNEEKLVSLATLEIVESEIVPTEEPTPEPVLNPLIVSAMENSLLSPLLPGQSGTFTILGGEMELTEAARVDRVCSYKEAKELLPKLLGEKYTDAPPGQKWFMVEVSSTIDPEEYVLESGLYGLDGDVLIYNGVRNSTKTHLISTAVKSDEDGIFSKYYIYYPIPNGFNEPYLLSFGTRERKTYIKINVAR